MRHKCSAVICRRIAGFHWMVRESEVVCVWLPPVAVIVTVLVPPGVVGIVAVEVEDPPSQLISAPPASVKSRKANIARFRAPPRRARCLRRVRNSPIAPTKTMHKKVARWPIRWVGASSMCSGPFRRVLNDFKR